MQLAFDKNIQDCTYAGRPAGLIQNLLRTLIMDTFRSFQREIVARLLYGAALAPYISKASGQPAQPAPDEETSASETVYFLGI